MPPQRQSGSALGWALGGAGLVAVLLALALLLDLGPFADDELSRGEFVAAADAICEQAHDAFLDLQGEPPQTARQAGDLVGRLGDIARDERDRIADLDGPADLDPMVESYLEARDEGIEALDAGAEAADADDSLAYATAQAEVAKAQLERLRAARQIGLTECSRPLEGRAGLRRDAEPVEPIDPDAPPTVKGEIGE